MLSAATPNSFYFKVLSRLTRFIFFIHASMWYVQAFTLQFTVDPCLAHFVKFVYLHLSLFCLSSIFIFICLHHSIHRGLFVLLTIFDMARYRRLSEKNLSRQHHFWPTVYPLRTFFEKIVCNLLGMNHNLRSFIAAVFDFSSCHQPQVVQWPTCVLMLRLFYTLITNE